MGDQKEKMGIMKKKIFILHGWAYSTEKWEPFLQLLTAKNVEYELVKIPGLTAPLDESWDLDDYVAWLRDILQKEKAPVVLLGHSNGGRIILAYSLLYPEKIKQLILIDAAGIYHNEWHLWLKRFAFRNLARFKKIAYSTVLKNILYKLAREDDYNKAVPHMKQTMRNLIESDLTEQLGIIALPTTIIWGEHDTTTPVIDAKIMHEKMKHSKLFIIKGARHSPQFTHVEEVADIVLKAVSS